jgi:hypothetical protein
VAELLGDILEIDARCQGRLHAHPATVLGMRRRSRERAGDRHG